MSRRRFKPTLSLAVWCHEKSHLRLLAAIRTYWTIRNAIVFSNWYNWIGNKWFLLRHIFHPRCKKCRCILFYEDYCFMCEFNRTLKVRSLRP